MSERELWQEVLLLAVEDALYGPPNTSTTPRAKEGKAAEIQRARDYLTKPSKDLAFICSAAGIDMVAMIERMKIRLADAPAIADLVVGRKKHKPTLVIREPKVSKPSPRLQVVTVEGVTLTVEEWAARSGLKVGTILSRIKKGWPYEEAVTTSTEAAKRAVRDKINSTVPRGFPARRYTFNGEALTAAQWAARTGIKKTTLERRLREGWPLEEALRPGDLRGVHMSAG